MLLSKSMNQTSTRRAHWGTKKPAKGKLCNTTWPCCYARVPLSVSLPESNFPINMARKTFNYSNYMRTSNVDGYERRVRRCSTARQFRETKLGGSSLRSSMPPQKSAIGSVVPNLATSPNHVLTEHLTLHNARNIVCQEFEKRSHLKRKKFYGIIFYIFVNLSSVKGDFWDNLNFIAKTITEIRAINRRTPRTAMIIT